MEVRTVTADDGSTYIDPPLDQSWSKQVQLQWKAAVVKDEVGVNITVDTYRDSTHETLYQISTVWAIKGFTGDFYEVWNYMSGISTGAKEIIMRRGWYGGISLH